MEWNDDDDNDGNESLNTIIIIPITYLSMRIFGDITTLIWSDEIMILSANIFLLVENKRVNYFCER